tara:strand:- start:254 stop:517 length:264 start_codon:yes stop_codon:yes gene_type:complete
MNKETMIELINAANRIANAAERVANAVEKSAVEVGDHNKIMSSFLLQATSESLFKKMTDEDIKKFVPQYVNTLDKVRDAAGLSNEHG